MIRLDTDNGIYLSKANAQQLVDGQKQTGDNITIISSYVKLLERSNYIRFNPLLSSGTKSQICICTYISVYLYASVFIPTYSTEHCSYVLRKIKDNSLVKFLHQQDILLCSSYCQSLEWKVKYVSAALGVSLVTSTVVYSCGLDYCFTM